jgi:hypothetical protein
MFQKLTSFFQGRHTFFAVGFALFGGILQWVHRLDGNYIALITTIQGFVFAHSTQENYFASKDPGVVK